MAFDWQNYYDLAVEMSQRPDEAALRTAISRAYYAAFCCAKIKYEQRSQGSPQERDRGSHEQVWLWYLRQTSQSLQQIGHKGLRLREERRFADYEAAAFIGAARVGGALREANFILQRLRST